MQFTENLREEYDVALSSYYRRSSGELIDARPEAAISWAKEALSFAPDMVEPADLAAIMSCCASIDPKTGEDLLNCFAGVDLGDEEAIQTAEQEASDLLTPEKLHALSGHPMNNYILQLFESEEGRRLMVRVAMCIHMTSQVNKRAACTDSDLGIVGTVTCNDALTDKKPDSGPISRETPFTTAIQHVPEDLQEAKALFSEALQLGAPGHRALAVLAKEPTQALAILNQGELNASTRFQADVLDRVVESVTDDGMDDDAVKDMLLQHLRPDVFTELLTGRGDLPATAVAYAPLEVVLKAVREECSRGERFERFVYWVSKLSDGYPQYREFLESSVSGVHPGISLTLRSYRVVDVLLAGLLEQLTSWETIQHAFVELKADEVIPLEDLSKQAAAMEADMDDLLGHFFYSEEDDEEAEDDEVSAEPEQEQEEADKASRGTTDEVADGLDL